MSFLRFFLGLTLVLSATTNTAVKGFVVPGGSHTSQKINHEVVMTSWAASHQTSLHSGVAYGLKNKNVLQRGVLVAQQQHIKDLKYKDNRLFDVDEAFASISLSGAYPALEQKRKLWLKVFSGSTAMLCAALMAQRTPAILAKLPFFYKHYPLTASIATCGLNAVFADAISQVQASNLNWRQTLSAVIYGAACLGIGTFIVYSKLMPTVFPGSGFGSILSQACLDNFVCAPVLWLPPAYLLKGVLVHQEPVKMSLQTYFSAIREEKLLQRYWTMWFPAQIFNFTYVPKHLRVLSTTAFSFLWFLILTKITSQKTSSSE